MTNIDIIPENQVTVPVFVPGVEPVIPEIRPMPEKLDRRIKKLIDGTIGPVPWYWNTFPEMKDREGNRYHWKFHGTEGKFAYVVSLSRTDDGEAVRLAPGSYARPFYLPPARLGIWFTNHFSGSAPTMELACFDLEALFPYPLLKLPDRFNDARVMFYALTKPVAQFCFPMYLEEGTHKIDVPKEFYGPDELLLVGSYEGEAAAAIFELHPREGTVKVLPQKWFTAKDADIGYQWITRVVRDPKTGRLYGDGIRLSRFKLSEDGCHLEKWWPD